VRVETPTLLDPFETANLNHWICFRPQVRGETPTLFGPLETANLNQWICFRPQVRGETPTLLDPLERANFNHWICFRPQVRGETPTLLGLSERANLNHWTWRSFSPNKRRYDVYRKFQKQLEKTEECVLWPKTMKIVHTDMGPEMLRVTNWRPCEGAAAAGNYAKYPKHRLLKARTFDGREHLTREVCIVVLLR
jgi:hypothetical protein